MKEKEIGRLAPINPFPLMLFSPIGAGARQKVATPGAASGAWAAGGGDPQMEERSCNCSGT